LADLAMTEVVSRKTGLAAEESSSASGRMVDRMAPKLVGALTVIGFGVPVLVYFWAIHTYSVNVILADQLADVSFIHASYTHHLIPWSALWAQHNENRMFFLNSFDVFLAHNFQYDIRVEEYVGGVLLVVGTALLIWAHKRRSPATPWLYYCPVLLLTLSLVQYENTVWGIQSMYYFVFFSLAVALALLDRVMLTWWAVAGAAVAGVVGSYSSFPGIFIWPVGMVLLYHRRRSALVFVAWIAAAAVTLFFYFNGLSLTKASGARVGPLAALKFFLYAVGEIVGHPARTPHHANIAIMGLGLLIVVLAVTSVVVYCVRRDERGGSPIGVALTCFGLLFAASVTYGRDGKGYFNAGASRYTTFDLLILVGTYLTLLQPPRLLVERRTEAMRSEVEGKPKGTRATVGRSAPAVLQAVVVAVVALQVVASLHYGLQGLKAARSHQERAAYVLLHQKMYPTSQVIHAVWPANPKKYNIPHLVALAEELHLSLFAHARGSG